jgi:hypothetical protein
VYLQSSSWWISLGAAIAVASAGICQPAEAQEGAPAEYSYLVGCYALELAEMSPLIPLVDAVERRLHLTGVPLLPDPREANDWYVVRPAPGEPASDFTSIRWTAWNRGLSILWRRGDYSVQLLFAVDHDDPAIPFRGSARAMSEAAFEDLQETRAILTRVHC